MFIYQQQDYNDNQIPTSSKRAGSRPVVSEAVVKQRDNACWDCEQFDKGYGCKLKGSKCMCSAWECVLVSETCPLNNWQTSPVRIEITGHIEVSP